MKEGEEEMKMRKEGEEKKKIIGNEPLLHEMRENREKVGDILGF